MAADHLVTQRLSVDATDDDNSRRIVADNVMNATAPSSVPLVGNASVQDSEQWLDKRSQTVLKENCSLLARNVPFTSLMCDYLTEQKIINEVTARKLKVSEQLPAASQKHIS